MERYEEIVFEGKIYKRDRLSKKNTRNYFYRNSRRNSLHRDIWKSINGEIPKGFHIHHKDSNPLNNSIENLECCSPKDHCRTHSQIAKIDPTKDIYQSRREWQRSEAGKKHHSLLGKLNWSNKKKNQRICDNCGKEELFYVTSHPSKTCKACRWRTPRTKSIKIKPEKFVQIIVQCQICSANILQKTSKKKSVCSNKCKAKARRLSHVDNINRKCYVCNKEFSINRYSKTRTCSDPCRRIYISMSMRSGS